MVEVALVMIILVWSPSSSSTSVTPSINSTGRSSRACPRSRIEAICAVLTWPSLISMAHSISDRV